MKDRFFRVAVLFLILGFWVNSSAVLAASTDLQKAKQESEAKGFIFETSHDEIVAKARAEGKLRALSAQEPETDNAVINAFKKHYPFIDVSVVQISGPDAHQRFLLELKAAGAADWDVFNMAPELYPEYTPYIKRFDILGMAQQKVLAIPPAMIDSKSRNILSFGTTAYGVAYNRKLIPEDKLPKSWEDFLKPEFKGRKFLVDVRPTGFANLAPGLGEKWVLDYARRIVAQDPVWVRGSTRALTSIIGGEQALFPLTYHQTCLRAAKKDPAGSLICTLIEPVPAMIRNFNAIAHAARHPYSSLLWFEFQATPEGQKIIDEYEEMNSFIFAPGSGLAKVTQGKKLSVNTWDTLQNTARWERMVFEAFGFPTAK